MFKNSFLNVLQYNYGNWLVYFLKVAKTRTLTLCFIYIFIPVSFTPVNFMILKWLHTINQKMR